MNSARYEGLRQWVVVARLGQEITARSAAARLSVIDKAERDGVDPPDVREWEADQVVAPVLPEETP